MRYAFVVNPISGTGKKDKDIISAAEELVANHRDKDIGIYHTMPNHDSSRIAASLAEDAKKAGEDIVIFSCGGDGTAHVTANGIYGYDNAILGIVPIGTGNDLCRALSKGKGSYKDYRNLEKQINGRPRAIDVIEISWDVDGEIKSCIAVNGVNIGFDGNTAIRASRIHEKTIISGSMAYLAAVFATLAKKEGQSLRITADDEPFYDGDLLMATMSNGNYCGGGIESCPNARLDDGLIELMAIRDVSRLSFVSKFPKFSAGKLFEIKDVEKIATYRQARRICIEPLKDDTMEYVIDGEVFRTPKIEAEIKPGALRVWEI